MPKAPGLGRLGAFTVHYRMLYLPVAFAQVRGLRGGCIVAGQRVWVRVIQRDTVGADGECGLRHIVAVYDITDGDYKALDTPWPREIEK